MTRSGTATVWKKLATFLEMIKFSHSVFALPFALVAMLVAARGLPGAGTIFWIVVAVVAARTAAMCFNRLVDREIDARNPRTRNRALVTGELSVSFAWGALLASVVVFYLSAAMLNSLAFYLSTPCLVVLLGYSLTKRFTHYSHVFLGAALGLAPIGAWIAVRGELAWAPILLGIGVTLWVAGFDILYACQDYEHDRNDPDLHSIPKKRGLAGAMILARQFHAAALVAFVLFWFMAPMLGVLFLMGLVGVGIALVHEHSLVRPGDLSKLDAAFFGMNGLIAVGLFVVALVDVLLL